MPSPNYSLRSQPVLQKCFKKFEQVTNNSVAICCCFVIDLPDFLNVRWAYIFFKDCSTWTQQNKTVNTDREFKHCTAFCSTASHKDCNCWSWDITGRHVWWHTTAIPLSVSSWSLFEETDTDDVRMLLASFSHLVCWTAWKQLWHSWTTVKYASKTGNTEH